MALSISAAAAQAGPYRADSTIGQSEAGAQSGGSYVLGGGFWGNTTPVISTPQAPGATLYLPAITRCQHLAGHRTTH